MSLKLDYVLRETASNFRRNITLTLATVITVTISLTLLGAALLFGDAVDNATSRWKDGVEFIVFMDPEISPELEADIRRQLVDSPEVSGFSYVDKDEAYAEVQDLLGDSPELVEVITPQRLPASFRVKPSDTLPERVDELAEAFRSQPGVARVVTASETIRAIEDLSSGLRQRVIIVAIILLVAAAVLILNTIRMALFSRRRDIEVMKLVGATNWFIRVPFMFEGLVQGLIGGVISIPLIWLTNNFFSVINDDVSLELLRGFTVDPSRVWALGFQMVGLGAIVGTVGSGVAVTRFLDT
ncbi:MAG: ABC transporter permease [Acidimicrobiia bacterium]|nr:ABC transporter permease [Acidimicrobiia bacterium]MCY4432265.1 permease-like cell division protein FtsX [bacterium]